MMSSGAKQLRRLAAMVLTLALLMMSFTVPALALEDWENLSVSVQWTDAQGNAWIVPAWSIPEDAAGDGSAITHGYWVTLDPQALGTTLTLQITHPDPAYTFWRTDWSLQLPWTAEKDAVSLDDFYADYIGYSYNGAVQVTQQRDCIKLYVSTQLPPFEVEAVEPSPGVSTGPEFITPVEPEITVPSEPEVSVPAEAVVPVYYMHENGQLLDLIEVTLPEGTHTLWPESTKVGGYELAGDVSAQVMVYADGYADVASVTFTYRDVYVAPAEATIDVYYVHENGMLLDQQQKTLGEGTHTLWPESTKVGGYELAGDVSAQVTVYADGYADVASVTFTYRDVYVAPAEATIDVYYVHENGMLLDQQQKTLGEGTHTLWPESSRVGGYELAGDSAVDVTVDAYGQTSTASVTFYYRDVYVAPKEATIPVYYYHQDGQLLDAKDVTLPVGTHTIVPQSSAVSGLELISEGAVSVTVYEDGSASAENVVFLYKDPYVAPVTGELTVIYRLENGTVIEQKVITLSKGEQTVWPESTKVGGLELVSDASVSVYVDGGGAVSPNPVVFIYREPAAKQADITIYYYDTMGNEIAARQTQTLSAGTYRIEAANLSGYELMSEAVIDVTVHADGTYSPSGEELSFWYRPVQTEVVQPEEPAPQQANVTIYYYDTMGNEIAARQTQTLSAGTYRIEAANLSGYELVSEAVIDVTVHADGTYSPSGEELSFWYRPVQTETVTPIEPEQTASVTVRYLDSRGKAIAGEKVLTLGNGTHVISPDPANVPAGYELFPGTAETATVIVTGGRANQDYVNFYFAQTKQTATTYPVTVYYYDTMGKQIATAQTKQLAPGTHHIAAQPSDLPAGYELASEASFTLTVGADGSLDRAAEDVGFWYSPVQTAPKSAVVYVQYVDAQGRIVSGPYSYELTGGQTYTMYPDTALVPEGYDAASAAPVQVKTSNDGAASPSTVLFTLSLKTDSAVIPAGEQIGRYGLVNGVDVAFRTEPSTSGGNKTVIFRAKKGSSVYMVSSEYNTKGELWTKVIIDGREGYMQSKYIDMLTQKASDVYAQSVGATPVPTFTPVPTATPEPTEAFVEVITPEPTQTPAYTGYAMTIASTSLRTGMGVSDLTISYLNIGEVVTVKSQLLDVYTGRTWSIVQTLNGQSGYVETAALQQISEQYAQQLIRLWEQQNATPVPTELVTNTPVPVSQQGYAYTVTDLVPFRQMPSEQSRIIDNLPVGTVGYIAEQTYVNGTTWHSVAVDGEWGYIRGDLIRLMTIAEEDAYLNSLFATPTPTLATTNRPYDEQGLSSYGYVDASSVNVRDDASKQAKRLGELKRYALCLILGTEYVDGVTWYQIDYNGERGYVHGDYFRHMTLREFSEFYGSDLYRQGLANNRGDSQQGSDDTGAVGLPSVEDQLVGSDDDFAFEFEEFVSPVTPIPNINPTHTPTLEPIVPGYLSTPVPTGSIGGTGMQESASDLDLPAPTEQVTYPAADQSSGGNGIVWIIVLALLIVAGGGVFVFVQHQRKRRRMALRAAQRRAQAARSAAGSRPYASQQQRTAMYPSQQAQPTQRPYQNTAYQHPAQNAPAQPAYRPYSTESGAGNAPVSGAERPYARKAEETSGAREQTQSAQTRRVGRRTAYQQALSEKQRKDQENS